MFNKTRGYLASLETIFLISCLGVMGIVLFAQVVTRYVFQTPLVWSEEAARYLHVWIALFGIHFGLRQNAHIRVTFFYDRMPGKIKGLVRVFSDIVILATIGVYLPGSVIFIQDQATIVSSAMEVNMGLVYIPSFIGFFVAFLYFLVQTLQSVRLVFSGHPEDVPALEETPATIVQGGQDQC